MTTTVIDPANLQSAPPPEGPAKDAKPADVPKAKEGGNIPPPPPPNNTPPAVSVPPAGPPATARAGASPALPSFPTIENDASIFLSIDSLQALLLA